MMISSHDSDLRIKSMSKDESELYGIETNKSHRSLKFNHHNSEISKDTTESITNAILNENKNLKLNYLQNTLQNKIGPIYLIGYLGSAILSKGKTGLGCLQTPLRELYITFRQNTSRLFQERRLIISFDNLTLLYNEMGSEKIIHNHLSSIVDIQLLRLNYEKKKDKKLYCAFLPFGKVLNFFFFF
jgi:hypothetical protein